MNFLSKIINAIKVSTNRKSQETISPETTTPESPITKEQFQNNGIYKKGNTISINLKGKVHNNATILHVNIDGSLDILHNDIRYNDVFMLGHPASSENLSFN